MERPFGRFAAVCEKCFKEGGVATRVFLESRAEAELWRCDRHGVGAVQENVPYQKPGGSGERILS